MKQIIYLGGKKAREYDGVDEPKQYGLYEKFVIRENAYHAHISTLPVVDVIGDCDWKEGEVKTKDVDYLVTCNCDNTCVDACIAAGCQNPDWPKNIQPFPVPIPKKQEGEEELWKAAEAEFIEQADIANYDISVITDTPYFRWLKRNFTITRKS